MKISIVSKLTFIFAVLLVTVIFFKLVSVYFGYNPLNRNGNTQSKYISFFPQGWAFFTKTSKEPKLYVFTVKDDAIEIKNMRNVSFEYAFGISRKNRIISVVINNVFKKISQDSIKCFEYSTNKIENIAKFTKTKKINYQQLIIDKKLIKDFKGKYLIVSQRFLPWSLLNKKPSYPYSYSIYPININ